MSDTDSVILTKPLNPKFIGRELGEMKLVHAIKRGIFIRKKFYYILDSDGKEIIKSSGISPTLLDKNKYTQLLNGKNITAKTSIFRVSWKKLTVTYAPREITSKGLYYPIKTIWNIKDTNFRFIGKPIKYNIIIHPNYPFKIYSIKLQPNLPHKIKISIPNKIKINKYSIIFLNLFLFFTYLSHLLN